MVRRVKHIIRSVAVVAVLAAWLVSPSHSVALDHACRPDGLMASASAKIWGDRFWRAQDKAIGADLAKLAKADRRHAEDAVIGLFSGKGSGGKQDWRLARIRWLLTCRVAVDRRLQETASSGS